MNDRAREKPRGRGLIWTGAVLTVLAIVMFIASGAVLSTIAHDQVAEEIDVPGTASAQLDPGEYTIWLSDGTNRRQRIDDEELDVSDPQGRPVPVALTSSSRTTTRNGHQFVAVGRFDVATAGRYEVEIYSDEAVTAWVAPEVQPGPVLGSVAGMFGSFFIGLVGIVLFVVGLVRRNRGYTPSPPPAPYGPPQGPPYQPAHQPPTYHGPPSGPPVAPPPGRPPSPGGWAPPGES